MSIGGNGGAASAAGFVGGSGGSTYYGEPSMAPPTVVERSMLPQSKSEVTAVVVSAGAAVAALACTADVFNLGQWLDDREH